MDRQAAQIEGQCPPPTGPRAFSRQMPRQVTPPPFPKPWREAGEGDLPSSSPTGSWLWGPTHPSCPSQEPPCCGSEGGWSSSLMIAAHPSSWVPRQNLGAGRMGPAGGRELSTSAGAELGTQMGLPVGDKWGRRCIGGRCLHGSDHGHVAGVRGEDPPLGPLQGEAGAATLGVHRPWGAPCCTPLASMLEEGAWACGGGMEGEGEGLAGDPTELLRSGVSATSPSPYSQHILPVPTTPRCVPALCVREGAPRPGPGHSPGWKLWSAAH